MPTHGHIDASSLLALEMKGWRKQQKTQMMDRQLLNKKFNYVPKDIVVEILSQFLVKSKSNYIPNDIVVEILWRLPAKPLIPMKSNYIPNDIVVEFLSLLRPSKSNYYIPNDIVVEILSRLPAKSLVRLKWACKYWFDLITSHDFIKMHLHSSTTHNELFSIISPSVLSTERADSYLNYRYTTITPPVTNYTCNYVGEISQCYLNYSDRTMYEVGVVPNEVSIVLPNNHRPLEYSFKTYKICGSCNGLILLEDHCQELCIWNPCTREYKNLPRPLDVDGGRRVSGGYGFGYDQTTDDYKVIRNIASQAQVYTLGTNAWRWIGPNPYILSSMTTNGGFRDFRKRIFAEGVFVNGALYWMDSLHKNIISFDIGKEKFQHVSKLPNIIDHDEKRYNVKLQVFEGSLCMVLKIKEEQNYCAEMWVLKDYTVNDNNNKESLWVKLITIPFNVQKNKNNNKTTIQFLSDFLDFLFDIKHDVFPIKPLRYIRNGEILLLNNHEELFLYDSKKNKTRTLGRISVHHINEVYLESLVCLNSGTFTTEKARKEQTFTTEEAREEQTTNENKNKELIFSFISDQNKIVFREYMRRSLSNQNKKKIVFKEKLWQGRRRHC